MDTTRVGRKRWVSLHPVAVTLIILLVNLVVVFGEEVTSETLDEFKENNWIGGNEAKSYDKPGDFKPRLDPLDGSVNQKVWVETTKTGGVETRKYSFLDLGSDQNKFCGVTKATISVRYFAENAASYIYPCIDNSIGNSYCYLDPPPNGGVAWLEKQIELDVGPGRTNEITIETLLIGYVIFDKVDITHDGTKAEDEGCTPTTTEWETTTEEGTTEVRTTEEDGETTGTYQTEEPGPTWNPITTTTTTTTTTLPTTTVTTTESDTPGTEVEETEAPGTTDPTTPEDEDETTTTTPPPPDTTLTPPPSTEEETTITPPETTELPPIETTKQTEVTTTTRKPSSSTSPLPPPPPPVTLPNDDKDGLTVTQILLFIVLPVSLVLLLFLGATFYYGVRRHRLNKRSRFKTLESDNYDDNESIKGMHPSQGNGGFYQDPYIQSRFNPAPNTMNLPPAPPQTSAFVPVSNLLGPSDTSQFQMRTSPNFTRTSAFILPPPKSPRSVQSMIPQLQGYPSHVQSHPNFFPDGHSPDGGRSSPASFSSSSRAPIYTGEYTEGGRLPRMRRKWY